MENQNIDRKENWRDEYLAWVSAFANAQGGVLEIGRNDKGVVVGLHDAKTLLEVLPNKIRNKTGVLADVDVHTENGKQYIRITVKPYPAGITYRGRYYHRSGSTAQELTGSALDEFLLRKQGKTWDGIPVPYISESEFNRDAFMFFREKAIASTRLTKEDLDIDDAELLQNLALTEGKYLKRAAILLFHQNPEKWVPGAYVKIGYFENDVDIIYQDEIRGPLISMPDRVLDTLYLKYFKGLISYKGFQRIQTYPVARSALRESVLNSVVHKDYSTGNPIQIRVYSDKVFIYNSGGLPDGWTVEKLLSQHESVPRNPLIAGAFYRSGMIESWGRGIERIVVSCREEEKPDPVFEVSNTGVRVLFADNKQTENGYVSNGGSSTDVGVNVGAKVGANNKTQQRIVELMAGNPAIKAQEIADTVGITKRRVEYNISQLKKDGIIERKGASKNGLWIVRQS